MDTKHKAINWTTLIGLLATTTLGIVNDSDNTNDKDNIKTVMAKEIAGYHEWKKNVVKDMESRDETIEQLRTQRQLQALAMVSMQKDIEYLSRGRNGRRRNTDESPASRQAINAMVNNQVNSAGRTKRKPLQSKGETKVNTRQVESYKNELFKK